MTIDLTDKELLDLIAIFRIYQRGLRIVPKNYRVLETKLIEAYKRSDNLWNKQ